VVLENLSNLVCLDALQEAEQQLEQARAQYSEASNEVQIILEGLAQTRVLTDQHRYLALCGQEAILIAYEEAGIRLAQAEDRWLALSAALASEKEAMLAGPMPRRALN
jgi:3-deoxy-D-arabino-heptulosonate 7-phosphate (DAHP) synthase class II